MAEPHPIAELLRDVDLFAGVPDEVLDLVGGCGRNVGFRAGDLLFREGDSADTFYVLRHGRVAIELARPSGSPMIVSTANEGAVVGWSWLFPPYRWHFDARAVHDIRAIAFDGACLRGRCDADAEVGYLLMQRFARLAIEHLQDVRLQLLDLYAGPGDR